MRQSINRRPSLDGSPPLDILFLGTSDSTPTTLPPSSHLLGVAPTCSPTSCKTSFRSFSATLRFRSYSFSAVSLRNFCQRASLRGLKATGSGTSWCDRRSVAIFLEIEGSIAFLPDMNRRCPAVSLFTVQEQPRYQDTIREGVASAPQDGHATAPGTAGALYSLPAFDRAQTRGSARCCFFIFSGHEALDSVA